MVCPPAREIIHSKSLYGVLEIPHIVGEIYKFSLQVYKFIWITSGLHVNNKRINNNIHHTKIVMALTSCDNTVITYRWKKKRADALH